jgi:hypothetical protein
MDPGKQVSRAERWEGIVDIFMGILGVVVGLALVFAGLQVFFLTLPLLGFVAGFFTGAIFITEVFGDGFLSTTLGIVTGILAGIGFALISYLWWYVGALIGAGALGALAGSGLAELFGIDTDWVVFIFAASGAVLFFIGALILNLPVYIVMVNTAFAGAVVLIAGILLIFNQIDYEELGWGMAVAIIGDSFWWAMVWMLVAFVGLLAQFSMRTMANLPEDRWTPAYTHPAAA